VVLSGPRAVIGALAHRLEADGVPARVLAVGLASHSRVMAPALAPFQAAIAHLPVGSAAIPMIAGTTGGVATPGQHDLSYWCRQLREPVQFQRGMESLRAMQIEICLEIGPGATLIDLAAAGGLLPHGGGVASLRRAGSELASVREAAALLRRVGAVPAVGADRVADAAPGCTAPWSALERRIG
jgi:acyl transferase domain-containing protein